MRTKIILLFLLALTAGIMHSQTIAYCNANNVNVREYASSDAPKIGKIHKYVVVPFEGFADEERQWANIEFTKEDGETVNACVASKYLTELKNSPIQINQLKGKDIQLAADPKDDIGGYLDFTFKGKEFTADYRIYIPSWRAAGGSGTVDAREVEGVWNSPGHLAIYEDDTPNIYDKSKGLLYFAGYLWEIK